MFRNIATLLVVVICIASSFILANKVVRKQALARGCGIELATLDFEFEWPLWICAKNGNIEAASWLGFMFWSDSSSSSNTLPIYINYYSKEGMQEKGAGLVRKAAIAGHTDAANELGLAHYEGSYGQQKNYGEALKWLSYADNHGDALASQNLAIMHLNGKGVEASKSKALEYLERSAERGSVVALWTMGSWHLAQGNSDSNQLANVFFAEADRLGHECRRPSEICDDFKPLFENEGALIAANEYVSNMELSSC